jgi:hypothetical protein
VNIPEEAIQAAARALERHGRAGVTYPFDELARAAVEAAAPLIAAQVLREHVCGESDESALPHQLHTVFVNGNSLLECQACGRQWSGVPFENCRGYRA